MTEQRRLSLLLAVMLVAMIGSGCGDDDPSRPTVEGEVVMPLDVGNTWHYFERLNEPGAVLVPRSRTILEHREVTVGDATVTVAVEVPVPDAGGKALWSSARLLRNEADGLYFYGTVDAEGATLLSAPRRVVPNEGRVGESYATLGTDPLICVAVDTMISTDFGDVLADLYELSLNEGTIRVPLQVMHGVGVSLFSYTTETTIWLVGYDFE